jgi:hypothetical protein
MKAATARTALAFGAVLVMLHSSSMGSVSAAPRVAKFKNNGAYINVSGWLGNGCTSFYLYAGKSGTTSAPTTDLYYNVYDACSHQWLAHGGGQIANSALMVSKNRATLKRTAAAAASFSVEGTTGAIALTLTSDGLYSSSYSGHSRWEYAGHVYQQHGSWTSTTATVSGTLLGLVVEHGSGGFGDSRDKFIEFDRGN